MAQPSSPTPRAKHGKANKKSAREIYCRPIPVQIHPLPTLTPQNPLSLLQIAYALLSELVWPPSSHDTLPRGSAQGSRQKSSRYNPLAFLESKKRQRGKHWGYYDFHTQSVHVTDEVAFRALWEQGFFGKGSLSRSEPEWIAREEARQRKPENMSRAFSEIPWKSQPLQLENTNERHEPNGAVHEEEAMKFLADALLKRQMMGANGSPSSKHHSKDQTSAEVTSKRREERKEEKRQRAKREAEALEEQLRIESGETERGAKDMLPNGSDPTILLSPPHRTASPRHTSECKDEFEIPNGCLKSRASLSRVNSLDVRNGDSESSSRRPSVRFAHEVVTIPQDIIERTVAAESPLRASVSDNSATTIIDRTIDPPKTHKPSFSDPPISQEHLQLSCVEAFFLAYGLGILTVVSPETNTPLSTRALLNLFRRISYHPPLPDPQHLTSSTQTIKPDDPFLLSYAVYHHFRSLGWVVRPGIKFAVDFLLYNRGPVFSHAEFAVLILPSYSHSYWSRDEQQQAARKKETKDWWWLHCANRVQNQVRKSLVLVYVDIPPPSQTHETPGPFGAQVDQDYDIGALLSSYRVREFVVGRWSMNRNRD